jgi:uracil-DNA glycosylase family protein
MYSDLTGGHLPFANYLAARTFLFDGSGKVNWMVQALNLAELARESASCRRCSLWEHATQTVFGDGPPDARLMLVGEQPGDQEDLQGKPFVGPAGAVLRRALDEAGIDTRKAYVTNAVKHFKFVIQRGKRRIHQKPNVIEIEACRYWFEQELATLRPEVVVALGATAARAVFRPGDGDPAQSRPHHGSRQRSAGPDHRTPIVPAAPAGRSDTRRRVQPLRRRSRAGRSICRACRGVISQLAAMRVCAVEVLGRLAAVVGAVGQLAGGAVDKCCVVLG